jgi:SAM-dependent methyltransferase
MEGFGPRTYGDLIADIYDELYGELDPTAAVDTLAALAGDGPVLELAIGTGRIALPLAERGVEVHGIDISEAMVERLRAKPGGDRIPVTIGDFADVGVDGAFALVYIGFNTFFALTSQDEQVRCFGNVAQRLTDSGVFALEGFVPDLTRFQRHQTVNAVTVELDNVMLDVSRHDPVAQRVDSQHIFIKESGIRLQPVRIRYAWPSELDLMARLAGLRLRERWSDWDRSAFGADSQRHVSVYERWS